MEKGTLMLKSKRKIDFCSMPTDYAGLVGLLPPRPLHDAVDYDNAMEVVMAMAGRELTPDQDDYLGALTTFIAEYDRAHDAPRKRRPVRERLKYLIEQAGMNASDLGRLLGSRGHGSNVLTGKRELSKEQIRILSRHFKLSADYFL